jgi:hypothetical protein
MDDWFWLVTTREIYQSNANSVVADWQQKRGSDLHKVAATTPLRNPRENVPKVELLHPSLRSLPIEGQET